MITVIIPVYNHAKKLPICLDTLLKQTYQNFDVIIVNDGSTDNFYDVIAKYKNKFGIRMEILEQENAGANAARNHGAIRAKGEFIIFCDADIIMRQDMLEKMKNTLDNFPDASYAYSSHKFGYKNFKLHTFDAHILKQFPFIHTTSLIRKNDFPGFDENIKRLQDWDLWLTMLEQNHVGIWINDYLFTVMGGGTMSTWLPSFFYKLFPFLPKVKKYKEAIAVIRKKHKLE
jgi:glycosyltransferase involved in cell wall biosynthesis